MDRETEKEIEESMEEDKITSIITTPTTSIAASNLLTTTDDDTSTESSDIFESWTLVNDKEKNKLDHKSEDSENSIDVLKNNDRDAENNGDEKKKIFEESQQQNLLNDDLSDGISIISESESAGSISPHPYVQDHLQNFNLKFSLSDHMNDPILNRMREEMEKDFNPLVAQESNVAATKDDSQHLRLRRKSPSTVAAAKQSLQKASQTVAASEGIPPFVRKGLHGIFYVGVGLAILTLVGKIVHPTWQPLVSVSSTNNIAELEQKINDIELQNNLMRAEIDLLNKQVKYLSTLNDPQQQKYGKYKDYKESKTFKAWPGNGDSLKSVDITKENLRKPYKCPDGSFVEIANMCIEQRLKDEPSIVEQFGQVVEDLKEQSELFKTFENVAEKLQHFEENPFEQLQQNLDEQVQHQTPRNDFTTNKPIYQPEEDLNQKLAYKENYQKQRRRGEDFHSSDPYKQQRHGTAQGKYDDNSKPAKEYKKSFVKDYNGDSKEFKKYENRDKFLYSSKERNEWKSDKFNNNSKEKKPRKTTSKEHFNRDSDENFKENWSKERYNNKQKSKSDKNGSDDIYNGEWQTNYMKHRENLRKSNEEKYQENKNWYIKRGDSRENKRSREKIYR